MHKINSKISENHLDAEIDEYGELKSFEVGGESFDFCYNRKLSEKAKELALYKTTGISQIGTTYPTPYNREEQIKKEHKAKYFYTNVIVTFITTILAMIIDFVCYFDLIELNGRLVDTDFTTVLPAVGAAVAIDILPLFIAHNMHRNNYDRKKVLKGFNIISLVLAILFITIIFINRVLTGDGTTTDAMKSVATDGFTFKDVVWCSLYILIPIATSLVCFIVNYLSFNPLEKKIISAKNKLLCKQEDVNELRALIEEIDSNPDYEQNLLNEDEAKYSASMDMVDYIGDYYKAYVRTRLMEKLKSPADTTDLSK